MKGLVEIGRVLAQRGSLPASLRRRLPPDLLTEIDRSEPVNEQWQPAETIVSPSLREVVSLAQAATIIEAVAPTRPVLVLGPPGIGKTDLVGRVASGMGLAFRSLLTTQLIPEDVLGMPHLCADGQRVRWAPPEALIPLDGKPIGVLLDELASASADVQRALHQVLLERRVGEHSLPPGSFVVAASNRPGDSALARGLSAALVNRLVILHLEASVSEWLGYAEATGVRREIIEYIRLRPEALLREPRGESEPFSTPRAWVGLSTALTRLEAADVSTLPLRRAVAFGMLTAGDAADFLACADEPMANPVELVAYLRRPESIPLDGARRAAVLDALRRAVMSNQLPAMPDDRLRTFFRGVSGEERMLLFLGAAEAWARIGGKAALREALEESLP